jgi:D-alanyl-lipoteichoic acid acyltransferase DltB (MBOAT superfamily)
MVFNSLTFLAFFALVLILHALPLPWTVKKVNLLLASYIFYAAWNPPFVLLLILAAVVDFNLSRLLDRLESPAARRGVLVVSLALNLGVLAAFKYGTFLLDNFCAALETFGVSYQPPRYSIVLPLGISFYTFETISYLVDVYRRRIRAWDSFLDYALFLTFFPHLVAGPIVRAADFLPQCRTPHRASSDQFGWGLTLLVLGLFAKVVLADGLFAPVVDRGFRAPRHCEFGDAWVATIAFAGQIYFDFAGYSQCGIGAALCLGFVLNDNFRCPYAAIGFSDFWQRWHMSLSSWLRDYLYIPLGGNRHGSLHTYRNLMLTMLLGGLWHGAAWRFVAWGGLHGLFLSAERLLRRRPVLAALGQFWPIRVLLALVTFLLVCVTWVFFRAQNFQDAFDLLAAMTWPSLSFPVLGRIDAALVLALMALVLLAQWRLRDSSLEDVARSMSWWLRAAVLSLLIFALLVAPGDNRAFIYFQF